MNELLNKQTMTSREIAEVAGKRHKNILQSIRNMEPAWEKVNGLKFQPVEYTDEKGEMRTMYQLTKTECLYIATKFNDEARARLVLRWEELEIKDAAIANANIQRAKASAKRRREISIRVHEIDSSINKMMSERKMLVKERNSIDSQDYAMLSLFLFPEFDCLNTTIFPNKKIPHK